MDPEERIIAYIDDQIAFNSRKNLFHTGSGEHLSFTELTRDLLANKGELEALLHGTDADAVIDYMVNRVLRELFQTNQYIELRSEEVAELRGIYEILLAEILNQPDDAGELARRHYGRLTAWLARTNPILRAINPPERPAAATAVCAEYSPELQLEILGIDPRTLIEPVMDIGCGRGAGLVTYLRSLGIDAHGLDRLCDRREPHLIEASWFEFEFTEGRWGTLVANLSFSTHFINNHLRDDGLHAEYAATYMKMLRSLKTGGSFHYAPSLNFIEEYLPSNRYSVTRTPIAGNYFRSIVTNIT